jgi:hypothetical protein
VINNKVLIVLWINAILWAGWVWWSIPIILALRRWRQEDYEFEASLKKTTESRMLVAHTYLGGWDGEDHGSRPTQANCLWDPISKITRAKWTGGVAKVVEHLLCKCKVLSQTPVPPKQKNSLAKTSKWQSMNWWSFLSLPLTKCHTDGFSVTPEHLSSEPVWDVAVSSRSWGAGPRLGSPL